MVDNLDLIHMNGRVYDSGLRRFISPDPFIQDPYNLQSINRYAYCWNNPMTNTDPSGYFSLGDIGREINRASKSISRAFSRLDNWVRDNRSSVAAMAFTAVAMAFCPPAGFAAYAYAGAVGFTSSYIASNGDLNAAAKGAIIGMAFMGVGDIFALSSVKESLGGLYKASKVMAHGTVGGLSSVASGGSFVSGFMSAGVSQAASVGGLYQAIGAADKPQGIGGFLWNAIASGVVGGTASSAAGGSFEHGALTAAMGRLMNDLMHPTLSAVQKAISENARSQIGSKEWNYDSTSKFPYQASNKCNIFVEEMAETAGANLPNTSGDFTYNTFGIGSATKPPSAAQWADKDFQIDNWVVVTSPQPGDVVAFGGHVGIITERAQDRQPLWWSPQGINPEYVTVSATPANGVRESNWGVDGRRDYTYRRYFGN
jgi:RHS repeat-associated protein